MVKPQDKEPKFYTAIPIGGFRVDPKEIIGMSESNAMKLLTHLNQFYMEEFTRLTDDLNFVRLGDFGYEPSHYN